MHPPSEGIPSEVSRVVAVAFSLPFHLPAISDWGRIWLQQEGQGLAHSQPKVLPSRMTITDMGKAPAQDTACAAMLLQSSNLPGYLPQPFQAG